MDGKNMVKVNDSIRRLLEGPNHDEIMSKVSLAKNARKYGARLRGTEPNDCLTAPID